MFDTVAYQCWLALPASFGRQTIPQGWSATTFTTPGEARTFDMILQHDLLDIRLFVREGVIRKVEAELPKLLYGHNARLIRNEAEFAAALAALKTVLQTICEPHTHKAGFYPGDAPLDTQTYYTRIDLVWQFDIDPGFLFPTLRNAKHPEIHKRNGEYANETLVFPGTHLRICVYDKKRKMRATFAHYVVRIEIRFTGDKLCQHFGAEGCNPRALSFDVAYEVYRSTLLKFRFQAGPRPEGKGSIEEFLAVLQIRFPDDDLIGLYAQIKGLCPRRARTFRRDVGNRVPGLVEFSFDALLPADGPPPAVEIQYPRKEAQRDQCFERYTHIERDQRQDALGSGCADGWHTTHVATQATPDDTQP